MGDMSFLLGISIEDLWRAMQQFQEKNNTFQSILEQQQMASNPAIPFALTHLSMKEVQISLPDKFNGNCSKFRAFVNQVRLIF